MFVCCQLFLDYILFLKRLASQADLKAEEQKEGTLQPVHIRAVKKVGRLLYYLEVHLAMAATRTGVSCNCICN